MRVCVCVCGGGVFVGLWSISVSKGTCSELLAVQLSKIAEACVRSEWF